MTQGKQNNAQTKSGQTKGSSTQSKQKKPDTKEKESKQTNQQKQDEDSKNKTKSGKDSTKSGNETKRSGNETARSGKSGSQTARSSRTDDSGDTPRTRKQNYFEEELKRLKNSLDQEKSKIEEPEVKAHVPFVFNTLEPYYNCFTTEYLMQYPENVRHEFVNRKTATGLCDPWVDHDMDVHPDPAPELPKKEEQEEGEEDGEKKQENKKEDKEPTEGSTRLPKYPVVAMQTSDLNDKPLYYSDVPTLREELDKKYSSNAEAKINEAYKRTKDDFYRMELHKMDEYHPVNRSNMRAAYFAYLQNNPGSKKAVRDCVKDVEQKEKEKEKEEEEKKKKQKEKGESKTNSRATSARSSRHEDADRSSIKSHQKGGTKK